MREIRLFLPVVALATASGCNEILGMDAREPFPETSSGGTGGSSSVSSSSTGGGGQGGGTGGAGGGMCDPDTGAGCGVHLWSKIFGDTSYQSPVGIASDAQGNVYVAGSFYGTIQLGGMPLISAGSGDVFLAKFDLTGNHLWSKRFGDADSQDVMDVAVDASGNVVITGYFEGAIDFGDGFIQGGDDSMSGDLFVAKFDANGSLIWSGGYGDPMFPQRSWGAAIDGSGDVVVVGGFRGTLGPLTAMEPEGYGDSFLIKFASLDGTIVWAKQFGDAGSQFNAARAIAIDTSDSIVMAGGTWTGVLDFGGAELTDLDGDIFLVRFDTNGNHTWSKSFKASLYGDANGVAVDSLGNLVVTGRFRGAVDLGGSPLASAGDFDAYLAKYSVVGEPLWSYRYGSVGNDSGSSVVVDATGDIVFAGMMAGEVDFGGGELPFGGDSDVFLVKFSAEGSHQWSRAFGDANSQRAALVTAAGSKVLFACATEGSINFGSNPLTSAGDVDVALAKFTP